MDKIPSRAVDRIRWRGPDAYTEAESSDRITGSARLAIIDLNEEANQPLRSPDGRWEFVFNGEIYNYQQLATDYQLSPIAKRSDSWTVLELINRVGLVQAQRELRGMYAIAALDTQANVLWLARDPFGIKPLFWSKRDGLAVFGSDPRALAIWCRRLGLAPELDRLALAHYEMLGYAPGDATMWIGINRAAPGSVSAIDRVETRTWPWPDRFASGFHGRPSVGELDDLLKTAVARHLVSDVEVGAFLSGGIDSSLVVALARRIGGTAMRTYSVGFDAASVFDESPQAEATARLLGCNHETVRIGLSEIQGLAERVAVAFPEPHGDAAAMPMLAMSERASKNVKVVLTGEGGDEMFGGYRRYWALPFARGRIMRLAASSPLGSLVSRFGGRRAEQIVLAARSSPAAAYARLLTTAQWDAPVPGMTSPDVLWSLVLARYDLRELRQPSPANLRSIELERHLPESYLEKGDRATMRYGLEARVPFLDLDLARTAARLVDAQLARPGRTKIALRQVARRYLPASLSTGPKRGFSVPLLQWMSRSEVAQWIGNVLNDAVAVNLGIIERDALSGVMRRIGSFDSDQKADYVYRLLILELWSRQCATDGAL